MKTYKCLHCGAEVPFPALAFELKKMELSHCCSECSGLNVLLDGKVIGRDYENKAGFTPGSRR